MKATVSKWRFLGALMLLIAGLSLPIQSIAQTLPYNFDFTSDPFAASWTQQSVIGAQVWNYNATFNNASMSAFASGSCQVNEDWLISPAFDLTSTTAEELSFDVQRGFGGDNPLEVLYSTNYSGTGDPNLATWSSITTITSQFYTDNGISNNTSFTFGPFSDLQTASSSAVYVAFKFDFETGSCSTWRVAGFSLISASAPAITASVSAVTLLNYNEGDGPSEGQSYTVNGSNLVGSGNVIVTAPAGFQVSLNNVFYGPTVNLPFAAGEITGQPRTLYVRLAAGQGVGSYSGNVTHTGGSASASLPVSGAVAVAPVAGSYVVDFEGPGETKGSYGTGVVNLTGKDWELTEVLIGTDAADFKNGLRSARMRGYGATAITQLEDNSAGIGTLSFVYAIYGSDAQVAYVAEYSTDAGASWIEIGDEFTASASPATFFADVNVSAPARVRIRTVPNTGTANRRMNIDDITITDFGVAVPQIFAAPGSITNLNYSVDNGPSAAESFTLSATGLDPAAGNISVTAPANFEVSADSATWSSSLNVAYTAGGTSITNNTVFVRLAAGLSSGDYSGEVSNTAGAASASVSVSGSVAASSLPELFDLSSGDFTFTEWSNEASAGSYPANMRFLMSTDPSAGDYNPLADGTRLYNCAYNQASRPRFNGLGENGFSFITTGSPQFNNCASGAADVDRYVGSAVIGLNTVGVDMARISWFNTIVTEGSRDFAVRLQYRVGSTGDYADFAGTPEFNSIGKVLGDTATINFQLPALVLNEAEVYLRLNYFQLGVGSGNRPEIGIDNILVTTEALTTPLLSLSAANVGGLYYNQGEGPSAAQQYTLSGVNLTPASGAVTVTAPDNFELSLDGVSYSGILNIGYNGGAIEEDIFVRLATGLEVGLYAAASITHSGGGAANINLSVSGEVGYPVNLGVGDVAVIGFRSVANDGIAFATFVDLPANTVILFTDRAFNGSVLLTNENLAVWQNTSGETITAGTVVKIGGPEFTNGAGSSLGELISGNLDGLAQSGDNIFALQGSVNQPTWVYGLSYLSAWLTEGTVSNPTSYLPEVLNTPSGNVVIMDLNAQYDGDRVNQSSFEAYQALVSDSSNWVGEADGALFGDFNTDPFVLGSVGCTANGGTLAYNGTRSICVGTGTPAGINIAVAGASGTNQRWGLIDNATGNIVAARSGNSLFNLDVFPAGNYSIRYIRYEDDTNLGSISNVSQISTLAGCYSLASNVINLFLRNEPSAGTLTAASPTTICANAGSETSIQVTLSGFDGESRRYGVVSQNLGNQAVLQSLGTPTGASFNLNGFEPGTYRVFAIAFQAGMSLSNVQFAGDLQGCFDLSNPVSVTVIDCAEATLISMPNPTAAQSFVSFNNPREEYATLDVYDMSGRLVERLFNQVTYANQDYRLEFNGSSLPNGVYMYRLTTDSQVVIEKFMIAH